MAAAAELPHPDTDRIELVEVLAALGHPVRLEIVRRLASGEEACCGEVVPDLPRSSVTHHLRTLRESGVIRQSPRGRKLHLVLRRDDLQRCFPGLLEIVLADGFRPRDFPGAEPAVGPAP
ncbi:ArsR/SmtB family transcription factor [Streptomyces sp. NPDC059979]|uniref:ArsR/SmtB family transcription factor n=1 Tax=unclassified Streptomyces TaxID=2593676 RepID=UPI003647042D